MYDEKNKKGTPDIKAGDSDMRKKMRLVNCIKESVDSLSTYII